MELFSFSRLSLFHTCPWRWHFKYVLGLDDPPGPAAIFGKTVHKAIELVLNGRSFDDAVVTAWLEESDMTVDAAEIRAMVQTALSYGPQGETERHFILPLTNEIKLQGYIDMLDTNRAMPLIADWKTGWKRYDACDTWQLPLYAAAVMEQTGAEAVHGMLVFLRFNDARHAIISKEAAAQAKDWAIKTAEEIQFRLDLLCVMEPHEAFPPKPSPECGNCPWSVLCLEEDTRG